MVQGGFNLNAPRIRFPIYLDQEEGDAVGPQRAGQFDIFHFSFNLSHLATVFVLLQVRLDMLSVGVNNCRKL